MPDLITHFASAYFVSRSSRFARYRISFYLGVLLPDLTTRPLYIIFPPASRVVYSMHTPIFVFLLCLLIAEFFQRNIRAYIRIGLLLGSTLHFGLDILQKHLITSYYWLYPFSWASTDFGFWWPDQFLKIVPLWILLILMCEVSISLIHKKHKQSSLP